MVRQSARRKRRNGGHAVRAPCAAFWRAALKSSDFDVSIVLVVADQAVLGLCSEPRSSGGLVRSGEAKCRGTWYAGARALGLRCGGCRSVFRGGRSSCHGPDRRASRASGRKGHIVLGGDQRAGSLSASCIEESGFRHFFSCLLAICVVSSQAKRRVGLFFASQVLELINEVWNAFGVGRVRRKSTELRQSDPSASEVGGPQRGWRRLGRLRDPSRSCRSSSRMRSRCLRHRSPLARRPCSTPAASLIG